MIRVYSSAQARGFLLGCGLGDVPIYLAGRCAGDDGVVCDTVLMLLQDLPAETRERLTNVRFDRMIEKHEGPWEWDWWLKRAEFLNVDGRYVLLPIPHKDHANIRVLRTVMSADEQTLMVYHLDTTYDSDEMLAGRVAICERYPGADFYVAMFYHEWYTIPTLGEALSQVC
ncbi:MAG: hypothetical protein HY820_23690 [Acidobacteria bacterium]|nr:hypothetical protein [Acidobacteriota bacterium]